MLLHYLVKCIIYIYLLCLLLLLFAAINLVIKSGVNSEIPMNLTKYYQLTCNFCLTATLQYTCSQVNHTGARVHKFLAESHGERILKISQRTPKLWTNGMFLTDSVYPLWFTLHCCVTSMMTGKL